MKSKAQNGAGRGGHGRGNEGRFAYEGLDRVIHSGAAEHSHVAHYQSQGRELRRLEAVMFPD